jgi:hypothetical protein
LPDQLKPAGGPPDDVAIAIHAWNLCGGMEWSAIPIVADVLGIRDVERLIHQLVAIRDRQNREH